jgi:hypothetical protein
MASNRIVVVWPSGDVVCEGQSALDAAPAPVPAPVVDDVAPETEPCPPTQPSPPGRSGIFRRAKRVA